MRLLLPHPSSPSLFSLYLSTRSLPHLWADVRAPERWRRKGLVNQTKASRWEADARRYLALVRANIRRDLAQARAAHPRQGLPQ